MVTPVRYSKPRVNALALTELLIGLQDGCHTMIELSGMTGLAIQTIRHYCNTMHRKGIVHICDWSEDKRGGRTLKVFALGSGRDMPKPAPQDKAKACAKYRERRKQLRVLRLMASNSSEFKEAA
jgi:hypothetical protein